MCHGYKSSSTYVSTTRTVEFTGKVLRIHFKLCMYACYIRSCIRLKIHISSTLQKNANKDLLTFPGL